MRTLNSGTIRLAASAAERVGGEDLLLSAIFSHLALADRIRVARCCKRFRSLAFAEVVLVPRPHWPAWAFDDSENLLKIACTFWAGTQTVILPCCKHLRRLSSASLTPPP